MDGFDFITTPAPEQDPIELNNGTAPTNSVQRIITDVDLHAIIQQVVGERKVTGQQIRDLSAEFTGVVGKTTMAIPQEKRGGFVTQLAELAGCDVEDLLPSPSKLPYTFTRFPNQFAREKEERTVTLEQVAEQIQATTASDKGNLPFLKCAVFGGEMTNKNCLRHDANVKWITGVEGDYDGGSITFDEAVSLLRSAGVLGLIYTTPSYTEEKPRWRVMCPTSERLPPAERRGLMDRLNGIFGGGLAGESWTLSQSYYFGNVEGKRAVQVEVVEGDYIDRRPGLPSIPKPGGDRAEVRDHPDAEPAPGTPISIEQLRAMGVAASGPCADLHYPELRTVIWGVMRMAVEGDDDKSVREEVARMIWGANTTSQSLTDDKFEGLLTAPPRYNSGDGPIGPGSLVHYAKLGGWQPLRPTLEQKYGDPKKWGQDANAAQPTASQPITTETEDDGGPITINAASLDDMCVPGDWVSYAGEMVEHPPVAEIIPKWVEKGIVTYEEGGGGLGKSYIAEQEAACIAAGYPIWGEDVEQADVLYLNYEEPPKEFERRLHCIRQHYGEWHPPAGCSLYEWRHMHPAERQRRGTFRPLDTSRFFARHLRSLDGGHILRVCRGGEIVLTRFGRGFLDKLSQQRDGGRHSYVVFDGLIDAILFEGSTRSEDDVARQVIALLDRWCEEYDFTGRAIIHPSRTGERTGTSSYAPAWTTKPRAVTTYKRVTFPGKSVTDETPQEHIFTRRFADKRSHGARGYHVDLQCQGGVWQETGGGVNGGEDPISVAVEIACEYDAMGMRIKKDGTIGASKARLKNDHDIIRQYRHRTGKKHGSEHFLGSLETALKDERIAYQEAEKHKLAGYIPHPNPRVPF